MPSVRRNGKSGLDDDARSSVYYYVDHFKEMLDFLSKTYATILTNEHHAFIARFKLVQRKLSVF